MPSRTRVADAYLKAIDGLLFGDAPQDGIRIGREFVHPGLRIAFTVPPGFALINRPQQVIAAARTARRSSSMRSDRMWRGPSGR